MLKLIGFIIKYDTDTVFVESQFVIKRSLCAKTFTFKLALRFTSSGCMKNLISFLGLLTFKAERTQSNWLTLERSILLAWTVACELTPQGNCLDM